MLHKVLKVSALTVALVFGIFAAAMEPLAAISPKDQDYNYYSGVVNMDQNLVNEGWISIYSDFNMFKTSGRIVPLADGSRSNPYNLVLTVNGNLYYVDAILNSVDSFKIRRRLVNNPEPGVFLRIEGRRVNTDDGRTEIVQLWIKIATPEGRALPVLKLLEGNYDINTDDNIKLSGEGNPGPLLPPPPFAQIILTGEGNPGPYLGPPPFQKASLDL